MEVIKTIIRHQDREWSSWQILRDDHLPLVPANQFLKYLDSSGKSPNTIKSYAHHLHHYFSFLQARSLDWKAVKLSDLAEFVGYLKRPALALAQQTTNVVVFPRRGKTIEPTRPGRSNSTVNVIVAAVTSFYEYHARLGHLPPINIYSVTRSAAGGASPYKPFLHNIAPNNQPVRNSLKLKTAQTIPKTISREEFRELAAACGNLRDRFLLCLLYESGMRIGQALGLRHEDIKPLENKITVCPRSDNVNNARAKTHSTYTIDVSEDLIRLYAGYLIEECGNVQSDYVFVNLWGGSVGRPLGYTAALDVFRRLGKKTGIKFHAHMLRHTHATEMLRATGGRVDIVSKRLGHRSIQTTVKIYAHLTAEDMKQAYLEYENRRGESAYGAN